MQKLGTLVEKCRVVLVAFNDEMLPAAKLKAAPEIFGDPPDQKRWLHTRNFKYPRQHGSRGGLAMRSRHNQDFLALQEFIMQQLRERAERNPLIEYLFKLNVPARDCVPYYHQVRGGVQIVYSKRL